jgi:hypothetical protein
MLMLKLPVFFLILFVYAIASCNENEEKEEEISRVLSTDKESLNKILNIETYAPTHVKYYLVVVKQPVKKEEVTLVAASFGYLQAVLYFDSTTFKRLKEHHEKSEYPSPVFSKDNFHFSWLDEDVKKELVNSSPYYSGHYDLAFETGNKGRLWFLDNKVLLMHTSGKQDDAEKESKTTK